MSAEMEQRYDARLRRYVTAMRNEKPDCIPIRPFVAEFTAKYAGYTCQQVSHDYTIAFNAACETAADFDWDAVVANMVYVWTGLTEAIGLRYYGVPGIHVPPNKGFQYVEPSEDEAFMKADEYDALIDDPTAFLYNVWLPRVAKDVVAPGQPSTYRNNLSFVRGSMAMLQYFMAFGPQVQRLKNDYGMPGAIAGIFKSPFDIIADKLRGYLGLTMDMLTQPEKVLQACEALMPHMMHVALTTADPGKQLPIGFWMHRGCTPFVTMDQFHSHYWPTLKPIIEELWARGHQTLFYGEGRWDNHLETFTELPERSIVFHIDQTDPFRAKKTLGGKFCLSGGVPNALLAYGSPDEVRAYCKKLIEGVAADGGYIMDASAIVQDDATIENMRAMTDYTREHGGYGGSAYALEATPPGVNTPAATGVVPAGKTTPGACVPWAEKLKELPPITGDADLVQRIWEGTDSLANMYIWQCLLSF